MVNFDSDPKTIIYQPEPCNIVVKEAIDTFTGRYDGGWHPPPATNYYLPPASSVDPMQVLATLAFVAFLLQNLLGLLDRLTLGTRVVQARNDKKLEKAQEVHEAIKKFSAKKWDRKK